MTQYKGIYVLYDNHISLYTEEDIKEGVRLKDSSYILYVLNKVQGSDNVITVEVRLAYDDMETLNIRKFLYDRSTQKLSIYYFSAANNNYVLMNTTKALEQDVADRVQKSVQDTMKYVTNLLI